VASIWVSFKAGCKPTFMAKGSC